MPHEPQNIAILLATVGVLLGLSAVANRVATRWGVPAVLIFLTIGMLAGSEGPGGVFFEDYALSFRVGTAALVLILFDGGLNTPLGTLRQVLPPAMTLATAGVVITAAIVASGARLFGFSWGEAALLGAIVSSTDAAAVFSVLRATGLRIRRRVAATLEVESGFNDPLAVTCTLAVTRLLADQGSSIGSALWHAALELVIGAALGLAIGALGRFVLGRVRLGVGSLYPVLTMAIALIAFGAPTLVHGSGFLAVYVAGIVIGNGRMPYRTGILRNHDFLAWTAQLLMFLTLGLLVTPSRLWPVAAAGVAIALWLVVLARPVAAFACLKPFGFSAREITYVSGVGLRGAVPIILATYPVLAGVPGSDRIFHVVFFVVVVSVLLQGMTARPLTLALGLGQPSPPTPPAVIEIASRRPLSGELSSYYIHPEAAVSGIAIREIPFPEEAAVILVVRDTRLIPAQGDTTLEPGDHAYVLCRPQDRSIVQLLFGRGED